MERHSSSRSPTAAFNVTPKESNKERVKTSLMDAMSGAAAGALAKTAVAPIERIKLLLQLQKSIQSPPPTSSHSAAAATTTAHATNGTRAPPPPTTTTTINPSRPLSTMNISGSAWNVAKTVYNEEGFVAFWRGNTPNVVRQAGATALNFMLMDWYKTAIAPILNATLLLPSNRPHIERKKRRKIISSFLSGGLAGGTTTTFLYPVEFCRTRLALDLGTSTSGPGGVSVCNRTYPNGMRDVFCTIWKTDGLKGFYQGYGIALTGVVVYRAMHLGGYEACKTELLHRRRKQSIDISNDANADDLTTMTLSERFMIAQIVSIVAGSTCYPIDSVRRRLMMQAGQPLSTRLYTNSIHAFRRIYVEEGMRGFYLGIGPNLMRSFGGALLLVSYDVFRGIAM